MSNEPMSNESNRPSGFASFDAWKQEFMHAATVHAGARSRPRLRQRHRFAVPIAIALALPAGAGIAVAAGLTGGSDKIDPPPFVAVDDGGPPVVGVFPGDVVGYLDLDTGRLITCPDGQPLTRAFGERDPSCSDDSVPEKYREQSEALEEWEVAHAVDQPDPQPAENGPNFQVILDKSGDQP